MNVPAGAKIPLVLVGAGKAVRARAARYEETIKRLARLEAISFAKTPPKGAAQIVLADATAALPLAGVIDMEAERARLEREIAKSAGEIAKVDAKLANADFVAKAPPEVVEENRERKADLRGHREKLQAALKRVEAGLSWVPDIELATFRVDSSLVIPLRDAARDPGGWSAHVHAVQFKIEDAAEAHALMRAMPLPFWLRTARRPDATHLPTVLKVDAASPFGRVECHLARPNSAVADLCARGGRAGDLPGCRMPTSAPAGIPPRPTRARRCRPGTIPSCTPMAACEAVQDKEWLLAHVSELSHQQEMPFAAPWSTADAPAGLSRPADARHRRPDARTSRGWRRRRR